MASAARDWDPKSAEQQYRCCRNRKALRAVALDERAGDQRSAIVNAGAQRRR